MNWDRMEGQWRQFMGRLQEQWGRLTHDETDVIEGRRSQLLGLLQTRYGVSRDEIDQEEVEAELQAFDPRWN